MKIRNGFVSNSSSSSYIIVCFKVPESLEEAKEVWFGDSQSKVTEEELQSLFESLYSIDLSREEVLKLLDNNYLEDEDRFDHERTSNESFLSNLHYELYYEELLNKIHRSGKFVYASPEMRKYMEPYEGIDIREVYGKERDYFKTDIYKQKLRKRVNEVFDNLEVEGCSVAMKCEYEDDYRFGSYMEHEFDWDLFPAHKRFSHH